MTHRYQQPRFQKTKFIPALIVFSLTITLCQLASGQIILDFSPTLTGGVRVVGSGSGTVSRHRNTNDYTIEDFDTDFLNDSIGNFALINADTVTGSITSSGGEAALINGFSVNRSFDTNDDLGWTTNLKIKFRKNQAYTFSLIAIFDETTLAYGDLILGSHFSAANGSPDEMFGSVTVNIESISEASYSWLTILSVGFFGWVAIRRRQKQQNNS